MTGSLMTVILTHTGIEVTGGWLHQLIIKIIVIQDSKKRKGFLASITVAVGLIGYLIYQFAGISME